MKTVVPFLRRPLVWVSIAVIYILPLLTLQGAVDMFLKLNGIEGESNDSVHTKEIDVLAWSWGGSAPASISGTQLVAGAAQNTDLAITKYVDKATPSLMLRMVTGNVISDATLTVRKAGTTPVEYIKIVLTNVLVTSLSTGSSGGEDRLTENVTFFFGKVAFTYTPTDSKGGAGTPITTTWDVGANKGSGS